MRLSLFAIILMASVSGGCDAGNSGGVDISNPFDCGVALSVYYGIAKSTNNPGAPMLERRMRAEAMKAAALPASQRTRAKGEALSKRLMENPDEAFEAVEGCMKRQDAQDG